jgi:hypothetical protein
VQYACPTSHGHGHIATIRRAFSLFPAIIMSMPYVFISCSGLRQCLAQFVSELSLFNPLTPHGVGGAGALYCVSTGAVNRLKSLAEDGDVDR